MNSFKLSTSPATILLPVGLGQHTIHLQRIRCCSYPFACKQGLPCLHLTHACVLCDWRVRMLPTTRGFCLLQGIPEQVDGCVEEVGHADTRKTMAESRSENSSVFHSNNRAKTKSLPKVFSARCHDLHVRASLGPFRDEGCLWAGMDSENRLVDHHLQ